MPRVHTQKKSRAGKDRSCGRCGRKIEVGETYYSWSFFRQKTAQYRCHLHRPRPSELTQSKLSDVYAAAEDAEDQIVVAEKDDLESIVQAVGETAQEIADEYHEAAESFGGEGENAERGDELESWADELNSWDLPDEDLESQRAEALELVQGCPI